MNFTHILKIFLALSILSNSSFGMGKSKARDFQNKKANALEQIFSVPDALEQIEMNTAPYGYSFNDLLIKEGKIKREKFAVENEWGDTPLTDSERFLLALGPLAAQSLEKKVAIGAIQKQFSLYSNFRARHSAPAWGGLCHQAAGASINPIIHDIIQNTNGIVCPTLAGTSIVLNKFTLRELFSFFHDGGPEKRGFGGDSTEEDPFLNRSALLSEVKKESSLRLRPHIFHYIGHKWLKEGKNFILNVAPVGAVLNRAVKSMTSTYREVKDLELLDEFNIPPSTISNSTSIFAIRTKVVYFEEAPYHGEGSEAEAVYSYLFFNNPTLPQGLDSVWIGPNSYSDVHPNDHQLTSRPPFMWRTAEQSQAEFDSIDILRNPGEKLLIELIKTCAPFRPR